MNKFIDLWGLIDDVPDWDAYGRDVTAYVDEFQIDNWDSIDGISNFDNGQSETTALQGNTSVGTVTAEFVVTASVTGVEATSSVATVSATGEQSETSKAGKSRRRRPIAYTHYQHQTNAKAKVVGVEAVSSVGSVKAIGASNFAVTQGVGASAGVTTLSASGIQNPTDEELAILLLAA